MEAMNGSELARAEPQTFTVRMPMDLYEALRTYAHVTHTSMNEVVVQSVGECLAHKGRQEEFDRLLDDARSRYRLALDKLADM